MTLLGAVLRELRFASAAYRWLDLGPPFRVRFTEPGLRGVHLLTRGACDLHVGGDVWPLTAGDLVILPRGDPHLLTSPGATATGPSVSGVALATRTDGTRLRAGPGPADTTVVCGAFTVAAADHPALRTLPPVLKIEGAAGVPPSWLSPLVEALAQEAFDGGPGSDLIMARLSDAMLIRALRQHAETAPPGWLAALSDPALSAALSALHADPAAAWTLAGLARAAGLSRATFAARFAAVVGVPPMRYLLDLRMHQARALLRDGATVAAAAARVGYRSESAFAAAFKRETGVAPGAYARSVSGLAGPDGLGPVARR